MKMIVMGSVVLRAQGDLERITGGCLDLAEKARLIVVAVPVARNGDARAIFQAEPGQIQRIGRGVLTAPVAPRNVAAGKTAEVIDSSDRLTEYPLCRRLQTMPFEHRISRGQRTGGQKRAVEANCRTADANSVLDRAARLRRAVGHGHVV